jgi:hypothetical protein
VRRRRSAGLTYFFRPRGAVADLFDDAVFFLAPDEADFDDPDFVPLFPVTDPAGFLVGVFGFWLAEFAVSEEDFPAGSSSRFPSIGVTARNAQSIPASNRPHGCTRKGEKTELILSM